VGTVCSKPDTSINSVLLNSSAKISDFRNVRPHQKNIIQMEKLWLENPSVVLTLLVYYFYNHFLFSEMGNPIMTSRQEFDGKLLANLFENHLLQLQLITPLSCTYHNVIDIYHFTCKILSSTLCWYTRDKLNLIKRSLLWIYCWPFWSEYNFLVKPNNHI
jgi:hypothetical protein